MNICGYASLKGRETPVKINKMKRAMENNPDLSENSAMAGVRR